ncbi:efflux RND transporter periplasmic adaptor subunit [Undibacterium flavidum]|uniref:Efflux RND transporter periplasmic adaptor subunit n=1 Tax=Undibacterium flavidum TaxID=2762297 RepID=A0ABR6YDS5_9BURK|nr:efflux RND transporter periplasmic adaptor subunit [Undibacterium flavidum]MBC3874683.1 efflux RND transporter periplasmic adaptor subunit [Undibacterium flavidum]
MRSSLHSSMQLFLSVNLSRKLLSPWSSDLIKLVALSAMLLAQVNTYAQTPVASTSALQTATARGTHADAFLSVDGVVEAVRNTVISAQISGSIVQLPVKAGDTVKAGQLLVRMDARTAQQEFNASKAQVDAAKANLAVAEKDYDRQKLLFEKNYISQAQLDRALAQFKSASAQANAQIAQAGAVQTQSGFYTINAPYDGIVSDMPSAIGEMVMPGKPIMTVYDPKDLRVIVTVPQARIAGLKVGQNVMIEFPSLPSAQRFVKPHAMTILPLSDAATHTVQVRFDLPNDVQAVNPGLFARVNLAFNVGTDADVAGKNPTATRVYVPATAVFRRAELYAVYVINAQAKPMLRQVKLGPKIANEQEILSGVAAGEKVAIDPLAAAQASKISAQK